MIKATTSLLQNMNMDEEVEMIEENEPAFEIVAEIKETNDGKRKNAKESRFAKKTEAELDVIADKRLVETTKKTTKCGVKIFQGKYS